MGDSKNQPLFRLFGLQGVELQFHTRVECHTCEAFSSRGRTFKQRDTVNYLRIGRWSLVNR